MEDSVPSIMEGSWSSGNLSPGFRSKAGALVNNARVTRSGRSRFFKLVWGGLI